MPNNGLDCGSGLNTGGDQANCSAFNYVQLKLSKFAAIPLAKNG
jgi:hypothetical protein